MSNEVGYEDKELFQLSNGRYIMPEELSNKMIYIKRIQPESCQPDNTGYSWDERMIPFPNKKYSVIYADPPWAYRTYSKKGQGRSAESHYPTMCIEDIKALPVGNLAAKDCALFLWSTFPCLCEALEVLTAWGFSYKTVAFVWIKQNRKNDDFFTGMGYWTRANAEICILATKGHPKRVDAGVRQVILSHIEEHSKKPDEARKRIVRLMGDIPRVELFARNTTPGWDVWGNEVNKYGN